MDKKFTARIVGLSEVYDMAYNISQQITESTQDFEVVVGIARGGFPPARLVCDFLNIDTLTAMQISHYTDVAKEKEEVEVSDPVDIDLKNKNVLIVDDVNDSGKTLTAAIEHVIAKEPSEVKTAVLHEKETTSKRADFVGDYPAEWKWLIYQWAVTEDLIGFLNKDDMLTATKDRMRKHFKNKYELDVSRETVDRVLAMKENYLR